MVKVTCYPKNTCPISIEVLGRRIEDDRYLYKLKVTGENYINIIDKYFVAEIVSLSYTKDYAAFLISLKDHYSIFLYKINKNSKDEKDFLQFVTVRRVEDLFEYPYLQFINEERYAIIEMINGIATSILEYRIPHFKIEDTV